MSRIKTGDISQLLQQIAKTYPRNEVGKPFSSSHPLWSLFQGLERSLANHEVLKNHPSITIQWSAGKGKLAKMPWLACLNQKQTQSIQYGTYILLLFSPDMQGVYLLFTQGFLRLKKRMGTLKARKQLGKQARKLRKEYRHLKQSGFTLDGKLQLKTDNQMMARDYQESVIAYRYWPLKALKEKELLKAFEDLLMLNSPLLTSQRAPAASPQQEPFDLNTSTQTLIDAISGQGYIYEPWQIATFLTAIRSKPFLILAGVSGTGKTKLTQLIAKQTGGKSTLIPVKPDWTDSSDILGYTDLHGTFRAGSLLQLIKQAYQSPEVFHFCILDEMNLARVEYYFAEVLSQIENRDASGRSEALLGGNDSHWHQLGLPPNLALIGTVNMDETTQSFSRKVLDRTFTLELSEINFEAPLSSNVTLPEAWPLKVFQPPDIDYANLNTSQKPLLKEVNLVLSQLNQILRQEQLQVGYRMRNELFLFLLQARELSDYFVTSQKEPINPLDLALQMKLLPRISGGRQSLQHLLYQLLSWAYQGAIISFDKEPSNLLKNWEQHHQPSYFKAAHYPLFFSRVALMLQRLLKDGFTSFWL